MAFTGHTLVLIARHPQNVEKAVGFLAVDPIAAFPGLGRKLPHYGKYSYLGFEGTEPANIIRGQWQQSDSPLRVDVRGLTARAVDAASADAALPRVPSLPAEPRRALAELPPAFSQRALVEHVDFLAAPAREGRAPGSPGHEAAAAYIAERFKAFGLAPGGANGTYLQPFTLAAGPSREPRTVANVVGYIPGTKAEWSSQSVVVSAHYDHLGRGWPDVHKGDEGKVHPGADDNASGVAVMLELAHVLGGAEKPQRSIVFVAFTGEESGLEGSKHYVEHPGRFPVEQVMGVVNLDTVGRLGDQRLSVIGTGTATEWQHIFRGASFVTGVESRNIAEALQASDQVSFVGKGVPAVQIFTGAHADYHRPSDTADRIDAPGLVKVATFVREGVVYLAERAEPLTKTIAPPGAAAAAPGSQAPASRPSGAPGSGRRVSFGTVPDFAYQGPGVRVGGVVAGSPAEKAGIKEGDVLLAIDGKPVPSLQAFSQMLSGFAPAQAVKATLRRDGQELTVDVTLTER
jgi:Zn-dependent M28 family amino/carboxypeptidase